MAKNTLMMPNVYFPSCLSTVIPSLAVSHETVVAYRGDRVSLVCDVATDINSPTDVYWLNSSGYIVDSDTTSFLFIPFFRRISSSIVVHDITAEDGGDYTCVAENEAGSTNASATVFVLPYFTIKPVDIFTTNGSVENFTCEAEAFPPPTIHWVSLTQDLLVSGMGSGDESVLVLYGESLVFDPVLFEDAGTIFQCIGGNGYGENITSDDVTITGKSLDVHILMMLLCMHLVLVSVWSHRCTCIYIRHNSA